MITLLEIDSYTKFLYRGTAKAVLQEHIESFYALSDTIRTSAWCSKHSQSDRNKSPLYRQQILSAARYSLPTYFNEYSKRYKVSSASLLDSKSISDLSLDVFSLAHARTWVFL